MDPISIALGLAKFAGPTVAKWLGGDKAEDAAKDVVKLAERVTGRKGEDAEKAISADPKLALKFKQAVMDNEAAMDKLYLEDRQDARDADKPAYDIVIVDIARGLVRPITTLALVGWYIYARNKGVELSQIDYGLIICPLGFWFGERGIMKIKSKF